MATFADRDQEYVELKKFFEAFSGRYFPKNDRPAHLQPLAALAALEKSGRQTALRHLRQMIRDCIEMSRPLPEDEVRRFDQELAEGGIATLSTIRGRFSRKRARDPGD